MTEAQDHADASGPPTDGRTTSSEGASWRRPGGPQAGVTLADRADVVSSRRHPSRASESDQLPRRSGETGEVGNKHPALAAAAVILGSYAVLAAILIGSGLVFTHLVAHSRVGHWDEHVNAWFATRRTATWNRVSAMFTVLADTLGVVVVAAVVTAVLLIRRWGKFALFLLIGLTVELAVFLSTTYLVARPRPDVPHLGSTPSTFSWPSGHSAATLVLYGGIALLVMAATPRHLPRIAAWTVAVALTLGVALSRIYRGEHHPLDTLAGVALGAGALWTAIAALRTAGISPPRRSPGARPAPSAPLTEMAR